MAQPDYNPTPHVIPEGENATPLEVVGGDCTATEKLIIVMCGLPATGKTHIANRIARYISFFLAMETKIFNVGDYRRELFGSKLPAEFFDHSNEEFMAKREQACDMALANLAKFMKEEGVRVGILDSTNSTRKRRHHIRETLSKLKCKVLVLETICDKEDVSYVVLPYIILYCAIIMTYDMCILKYVFAHYHLDFLFLLQLIEHNIRTLYMNNTPDYEDVDPDAAFKDFKQRRENYIDVYETVDESDGSHIKIINSQTFIVHNARGYLPQKVRRISVFNSLLFAKPCTSQHGVRKC